MKLVIAKPVEYKVEVVERKGIGHPDTICDGVAEAVSRALSKAYLKAFGVIHHHNVDKVTLVAGQSKPRFGGGEIIKPIYLLVAGRATASVPVYKIAMRAAKQYIRKVLPLAEDEDFVIDVKVGLGASELQETVKEVVANDTSVGVGFAPLTEAEKLTLDIANFLNSKEFSKEWPEIGPDVKVMVHRIGDSIDVTIAAAFIDRFLESSADYRRVKEAVEELLKEKFEVNSLAINVLDDYEKGLLYLTVLGTSAEQGDDGAVGRGNRVNGLITPMRPMSLEATAGKNPVSHVGKLYNALAQIIAERIWKELGKSAEVAIQSRIGQAIKDPYLVAVRTEAEQKEVERIVREELEKLDELTMRIVNGEIRLF